MMGRGKQAFRDSGEIFRRRCGGAEGAKAGGCRL